MKGKLREFQTIAILPDVLHQLQIGFVVSPPPARPRLKQYIITRTKQHLYRQVVSLRITQEDHLESEEALVLPMVRQRLTEEQQLTVARALLIDDQADDPRWIVDWVTRDLSSGEQKLLADLEARFNGSVPSDG